MMSSPAWCRVALVCLVALACVSCVAGLQAETSTAVGRTDRIEAALAEVQLEPLNHHDEASLETELMALGFDGEEETSMATSFLEVARRHHRKHHKQSPRKDAPKRNEQRSQRSGKRAGRTAKKLARKAHKAAKHAGKAARKAGRAHRHAEKSGSKRASRKAGKLSRKSRKASKRSRRASKKARRAAKSAARKANCAKGKAGKSCRRAARKLGRKSRQGKGRSGRKNRRGRKSGRKNRKNRRSRKNRKGKKSRKAKKPNALELLKARAAERRALAKAAARKKKDAAAAKLRKLAKSRADTIARALRPKKHRGVNYKKLQAMKDEAARKQRMADRAVNAIRADRNAARRAAKRVASQSLPWHEVKRREAEARRLAARNKKALAWAAKTPQQRRKERDARDAKHQGRLERKAESRQAEAEKVANYLNTLRGDAKQRFVTEVVETVMPEAKPVLKYAGATQAIRDARLRRAQRGLPTH